MKIIILGDVFAMQRAGIYYYGLQLVTRIAEQYPQAELQVVVPESRSDIPWDQIVVPIKKWIPQHQRLRQFWAIPRMLNTLQPDIVIELAHFGPYRLHSSIARYTVIHDITPLTHPQFHPRTSVIAHRLLLHRSIKRSTGLIVNSHSTADQVMHFFDIDDQRIEVHYPQVVFPGQNEIATLPRPYHPYFLAVGSLEPRKNYLTMLRAFENYCMQSHDDSQLHIVGGDQWKHRSFNRALRNYSVRDRVVLHGHISRADLWLLYRHARAYVSISIQEGFGLPVLEALYHGIPAILSDISVYHEIAGDTAIYVAPGDAVEIASALTEVASSTPHPRREAGKRTYETIRSEKQMFRFFEKTD